MKDRTVLFPIIGIFAAVLFQSLEICRAAEPASASNPVISTVSLLAEMTDADNLARFPEQPYKCVEESSYDRKSISPDKPGWFANHDTSEFIRKETVNGHDEYVMMEDNGPGAIVRLWSAWAGGAEKATLRFYFDGQTAPAIEGPVEEILGGLKMANKPFSSIAPDTTNRPNQRAHNLFLPISYAKGCKVTYQPDAKLGLYWYQVHFRKYAEGTPVETFKMADLPALKVTIAATAAKLADVPALPVGCAVRTLDAKELAPGATASLDFTGPSALRRIRLNLAQNTPAAALCDLEVQLDFDGVPAVRCPVGYFFAIGPRFADYKTWMLESTGQTMACHWVMPFAKDASLRLVNNGKAPVTASLEAISSPWAWDRRSLHFHAEHKEYRGITGYGWSKEVKDWNYVTVNGCGRHVGDNLFVDNTQASSQTGNIWWGEGDEKIYVDGESFPSQFGTGTEDYYGYAHARPEAFSAPFHAQPYASGDRASGVTSDLRLRLLDDTVFTKSLKFDMELWHTKPPAVDWIPTTFYYLKPEGK